MNNRVLVVDRDEHAIQTTGAVFASLGWQVAFAHRAATARAFVERERPALVVTEILLPGEDGLSLCRAIKHGGGNGVSAPRVLVVSILAAAARAREAGADAFLGKPVDSVRLAGLLAGWRHE